MTATDLWMDLPPVSSILSHIVLQEWLLREAARANANANVSSSKTDPALAKAETISNGSNAPMIIYLEGGNLCRSSGPREERSGNM